MGSWQDKMVTTGTMDRVGVAPVKALEKFQDFFWVSKFGEKEWWMEGPSIEWVCHLGPPDPLHIWSSTIGPVAAPVSLLQRSQSYVWGDASMKVWGLQIEVEQHWETQVPHKKPQAKDSIFRGDLFILAILRLLPVGGHIHLQRDFSPSILMEVKGESRVKERPLGKQAYPFIKEARVVL